MSFSPTDQQTPSIMYSVKAEEDMGHRSNTWAPPQPYGVPRPAGDAYYSYDADSKPIPHPAGHSNSMSNSQPGPSLSQEHQQPYRRPEYHYPQEYQQPPQPSYQQPPSQYQQYQPPPPPHPSLAHNAYRSAPMPLYAGPETPRESPAVSSAAIEPYDQYQERREEHFMMRNQPPQMPGAPRVPNSNYEGKVPIPFTPPGLRIPAVRSGSIVPTAGSSGASWSATSQPDRVKIEDLLTDGDRAAQSIPDQKPLAPPPNEYEIFFRQQPIAARCCGYGERDRRVIDPPPIVQLRINNPDLSPDEMYDRIHHPAYVVHCSIWNAEGNEDFTNMPNEYVRPGKRIMGSLVSSPFVGEDENGQEGCFFCFPDMSVRTPGTFRLKFSLVVVDISHRCFVAPIKSSIMSDVFKVYNAKDFPGMQASTPLTKRLKEQGCLISIKKGNEKSGGKSSRRQDDSDEDDEEGGGQSSKRRKSRKQR